MGVKGPDGLTGGSGGSGGGGGFKNAAGTSTGGPGNTPSTLAFGEVALNYADGKLFYKNGLGGTDSIPAGQYTKENIISNDIPKYF